MLSYIWTALLDHPIDPASSGAQEVEPFDAPAAKSTPNLLTRFAAQGWKRRISDSALSSSSASERETKH